jgi:hypothetical protein
LALAQRSWQLTEVIEQATLLDASIRDVGATVAEIGRGLRLPQIRWLATASSGSER